MTRSTRTNGTDLRRQILSTTTSSRRMLPGATRIVILVIILTFIAVMAALGCAPAVALGVAAGAVAIVYNPRAARVALGALG
jgi:hypothetical protein